MENFGLYSTLARLREEQALTNAERTAARREEHLRRSVITEAAVIAAAAMPYEPNSGLVYSETVVESKPSKRSNPETWCLGKRPEYKYPAEGSEELVSIAMRSLLCNLDMLDGDSLGTVPTTLLEKIWKAITRARLDNLRVWKLFAQSSIGDSLSLEARRPVKFRSMGEVIQLSFHTTCAWITSLYITCPKVSQTDLVTVSELDNLRSFHMATSQHTPTHQGLNDRVLRGWANAARFEGALQNLRFIFLYSQREVTKWSLDHLAAFPSLEEFCAYNCGIHWRSVEHKEGWLKRPADSFSAFVKSSAAHQQQPWHGTFYSGLASWDSLVAMYVTNRLGFSTEHIDKRPLLKATINRHAVDHRLDRPAGMVCLKRSSDLLPSKEEAPLDVENIDLRPVVKRRKIVFDSENLGGMLGA